MKFLFVDESWEDYLYWQKHDKKMLKRIYELLKDISRQPFTGFSEAGTIKIYIPGILVTANYK